MKTTQGNRWLPRFRVFVVVCLGIMLASVVGGCSGTGTREGKEARIGVLLPLTGPLAEYGNRVKRGVDLAVDEINSRPGAKRLQVFVEDSRAEPRQGISAFQKMTTLDHVRYICGDVSSSVTLALVPQLEERKVLLFSPAASSPALTGASRLFARNWPTDSLEASSVAQYAFEQNCKTVAILAVNVDYGVGLANTFASDFSRLGGKVLLNERFPLDNRDFRSAWQKVIGAKPECVYFVGHQPEIMSAIAQYREAGIKIRLFGNTNFEDPQILSQLGSALEGIVYGTATLDVETQAPIGRTFVKAYRAKYANEPPTLYSANGYDIVRTLYDLQLKHGTDVEAAMTELKSGPALEGAAGTFRILSSGDVKRAIAIKTIRDGKFVMLGFF